ncbi:MAG: fimbrial biogenesis chaperone [Chitinophagaceae bacterium]
MRWLPYSLFIGFIMLVNMQAWGQSGITTSPSRIYFHLIPGSSGAQRIRVSNPGVRPLDVGVALGDWDYDSLGNNQLENAGTLKISCAKWIQILPGTFFTLPPNSFQDLTVSLTVPNDADTSVPVHTAMVYFTQLNPIGYTKSTTKGAVLIEAVRMGVKIYQNYTSENKPDVEITNFQDLKRLDANKKEIRYLKLSFTNSGQLWLKGKIEWELLDLASGKKIKMLPQYFYSLPGDHRIVLEDLPNGLKKGKYSVSAIINYGNKDDLKIAELDFNY